MNCGGLDCGTGLGSGCRPHMIVVNRMQMPSTTNWQTAVYDLREPFEWPQDTQRQAP